jgi:hypothetical protein
MAWLLRRYVEVQKGNVESTLAEQNGTTSTLTLKQTEQTSPVGQNYCMSSVTSFSAFHISAYINPATEKIFHWSAFLIMADPQRETSPSSRRSRGADSNERNSPRQNARKRSRSPRREGREDKPRRKDAGFRWKEKRRDDDERHDRDSGFQRGYRDHYRPRSRSRSPRPRSPGREDRDRERKRDSEDRPERKKDTEDEPERKEKKKEKRPAPAPQQEMIIVTVNDRLGTKKAIPCFASDSVSKWSSCCYAEQD